MFQDLTFFELLAKGGWTMLALACFSVLSVAVMLERGLVFYRAEKGKSEFLEHLKKVLRNGNVSDAISLCGRSHTSLAYIVKAGLSSYHHGEEAMGESMEKAAMKEVLHLEKNLGIIGTTGAVAPFVGLFGTVLGIIRAFHDLSLSSGGGPAAVSNGIAEALVATAAGLFVAVPAVIMFNYYTNKVNRMVTEMEATASEAIDVLLEKRL
ncbi:MAG TPA: MotA/TolQ/ExbB proton channel family protein [Nitrospirota bacterium]|jgi:biopolymer transport protein ExbB/TolQ